MALFGCHNDWENLGFAWNRLAALEIYGIFFNTLRRYAKTVITFAAFLMGWTTIRHCRLSIEDASWLAHMLLDLQPNAFKTPLIACFSYQPPINIKKTSFLGAINSHRFNGLLLGWQRLLVID
ncbi:hypothetical protein O9992_16210 [Vibrio lentus]|nr:hypothetical protein [Vibrio lentus]